MIRVSVQYDDDLRASHRLFVPVIRRAVRTALRFEGVRKPCEVSVFVTDDAGIRRINREFRGINKPTDVLSFPIYDLRLLGDIVLSGERVARQSRQYRQSRSRETAYLTVHSVLHLLGYDHIDADEKKIMRSREDAIMARMF